MGKSTTVKSEIRGRMSENAIRASAWSTQSPVSATRWARAGCARARPLSFEEYRLYRRDDKGRIVKQHDHLMDCTRYVVRARTRMKTQQPSPQKRRRPVFASRSTKGLGWMG